MQQLTAPSQPTQAQQQQANQLARNTLERANKLEAERIKTEQDALKEAAAKQKQLNAQTKRCKKHDLAIEHAQANLKEAHAKALKKGTLRTVKKQSDNNKQNNSNKVTASRVDDDAQQASLRKAKQKVEMAQAKKALDCSP